ncbi:MAG: hypothetical protein LC778_14505 [Acidobacteria bacterium]|nr:hypothetical protein [Acidobacteriota bacterium]
MNKFRSVFSVYLTFGLVFFGLVNQTFGQAARNERDVRNTLRSINSKVDDFRYSLDAEFRRSSVNRDRENEITADLRNFEESINKFEDKFQRRRENANDVSDVLSAAKSVNDFLRFNQFGGKAESDWANIRALLNRLASNYQVNVSWNGSNRRDSQNNRYPNNNRYPSDNRSTNDYPSTRSNSYNYSLTGTYQLDVSRSDDPRDIANRAIRNGNVRTNPSGQSDLESKLEAPEQIAIDVRGTSVTLASSRASQITFAADGRERTERLADGRTLRVRGTLRGQELTISSLGGDTDYTVVFSSIENGNSMRVTRRITTDYLRQTVFAESVYNKTDSVARLGINNSSNDSYSSNDPQDNRGNYPNNYPNNYPTPRTGRSGNFIVPNGTILTGILENEISTNVSQNNDRFRMTVQSPNQYRGAIIEGYLSGINRSGKVTGRSQITFNFERIRLSNGQTYEFAGFLQSVTDANGETVQVDTEGTAKGDSQTRETVKRSVVLQGKDDLELRAGSSITVQASSSIR